MHYWKIENKNDYNHYRGVITVELFQSNGDVYTGDFENGMRSGQVNPKLLESTIKVIIKSS